MAYEQNVPISEVAESGEWDAYSTSNKVQDSPENPGSATEYSDLGRSWPGFHRLPPRCEHDAFLHSVGRTFLHHDCVPGARQPGA